uniref:BTB domain-containing protein n=1 Tax=Panagrolaimus sp. PS1159 TaxID=55785 RepID=A0AC35F829_9BILA
MKIEEGSIYVQTKRLGLLKCNQFIKNVIYLPASDGDLQFPYYVKKIQKNELTGNDIEIHIENPYNVEIEGNKGDYKMEHCSNQDIYVSLTFLYDPSISSKPSEIYVTNNKKKNSSHATVIHESPYENLIGAAELDENTEGLKKDKFGSIKMSKQCFADSFKSQNPFEFPRQKSGDQKNKPEAMQFKASQRLLGSSRPSSAVITMSSSSDSSSYSSSSSDSESQEQHGNAPKQQPIARQLCLRKTSAQGKPADEPVAKVPRLGPNPRNRDAKLLKKRKADLAKMISKLGESRTQEAAKDTPLRQPMPNDTPSIPQESTYESTKEANSYWYKILSNERYTDAFLIASDKTKVSTHRCVLAEHSQIFAKIIDETSELPVTIN